MVIQNEIEGVVMVAHGDVHEGVSAVGVEALAQDPWSSAAAASVPPECSSSLWTRV